MKLIIYIELRMRFSVSTIVIFRQKQFFFFTLWPECLFYNVEYLIITRNDSIMYKGVMKK